MAKKPNEIYVEPHPQGFAVERPGAQRASVVTQTQAEAIKEAARIAPTAAIHVARVRHTSGGHPDQYRNPS